MKLFTAMVSSDDGKIYKIDVIEHENKLWLVPRWLDVPTQGLTMPARLIRMDALSYQKLEGFAGCDFGLNDPVPKVLLDPTTPKTEVPGFEVLELPELRIPIAARRTQSVGSAKPAS